MAHERPGRIERRLSAIMAADVAGYSRLMHNDEEATHAALTALLADAVEPVIAEHGGHIVKNTGDGILATFDGPARAIRCAQAIASSVKSLGIEVRAGLHTGEVELRGEDVTGIGVTIAARVMDAAGPGEVVVSSTVKDLVAGSGLRFADRGMHALKGVPDEWRLFAVER